MEFTRQASMIDVSDSQRKFQRARWNIFGIEMVKAARCPKRMGQCSLKQQLSGQLLHAFFGITNKRIDARCIDHVGLHVVTLFVVVLFLSLITEVVKDVCGFFQFVTCVNIPGSLSWCASFIRSTQYVFDAASGDFLANVEQLSYVDLVFYELLWLLSSNILTSLCDAFVDVIIRPKKFVRLVKQ